MHVDHRSGASGDLNVEALSDSELATALCSISAKHWGEPGEAEGDLLREAARRFRDTLASDTDVLHSVSNRRLARVLRRSWADVSPERQEAIRREAAYRLVTDGPMELSAMPVLPLEVADWELEFTGREYGAVGVPGWWLVACLPEYAVWAKRRT